MEEEYDLAAEIGFRELPLSSGGLTEDQESVLVLGNKPKGLENQDIYLRYARERSWLTSPPQAFYAERGVFNSTLALPLEHNTFAQNGWSFKTYADPDGNKTSKKYYVRIENTKTDQVYVGIPVTQNHFHAGVDPTLDSLLIVDEQSFLDNPNLAMSLNHQKIKVEAVDGHWAVAKNDPLADRIKLPGNTIEANNPETIYLLTEKELAGYNSKGDRKGWEETELDKEGLRSFVKYKSKTGASELVDRRFVKEIMIPQEVNGEEIPVKHYLMSDAKTLESIEIMEPTSKEEESADADETVSQPASGDPTPLFESGAHFANNVTGSAVEQEQIFGDPRGSEDPGIPENLSESEIADDMVSLSASDDPRKSFSTAASEKPSDSAPSKDELTGVALDISKRIATSRGDNTLSAIELAFLEELNAIQDDPKKLKEAMASIQNSPLHERIIETYASLDTKDELGQSGPQGADPQGSLHSNDLHAKTETNGGEAAFGAAAGLGSGLIQGAFGAVKTVASGTMTAVNKIIENHHKRKQYRLENPDVVEKEKAASKERLMVARRAHAEDSNSILDAKIASVLGSKQFIDKHPAVEQMYNMIEDDPTLKDELGGWLEDTAEKNPVFAEHLNNVKKNAGGVARRMEENLQLNNLAGADLEDRKGKFEQFNESFINDPLGDVLPDAGVEVPDGEQATTIKESITKAINNIMKMLKDMMLKLMGKSKEGHNESADQGDCAAPSMSR